MPDPIWFATVVSSPEDRWCARLLLASLRAFGGALAGSPVLLFSTDMPGPPGRETVVAFADQGVQIVRLPPDSLIGEYLFATKVRACARAEEIVAGRARTLAWLDPRCLVVKPPEGLALDAAHDAALRPVHIRNVGSPSAEMPDDFWQAVFAALGLPDVELGVESYVDAQRIRAYFNCGTFAVNPNLGLMRRWRDGFARLANDRAFQAGPCADELHRIFLHQAVFSALLASEIELLRIRFLPPAYGYPVHLHHRVPADRRPAALNDLTTIIHEDLETDALGMNGLEVHEPLAEWLRRQIGE